MSVKNALPLGSRIGNYVLRSVLGEGGFGIVYKAQHYRLSKKWAAIKEYLPNEFAVRDVNQNI